MPLLKKISLTWFRNFEQQQFEFQAPLIGIAGPNGIGKTNLMDAVYYLCYTKSYFQNREQLNIQTGRDGFRIHGIWQEEQADPKNSETTCLYKDNKKTILQDDIPYNKIADHIGSFHAVMIAPDDLNIINQGSDMRRKFINGWLGQTDKEYLDNLLAYQRILQQKNAYLKTTPPNHIQWHLIDVYNRQLAQHGSGLIRQRQHLAEFLPQKVQTFYEALSGKNQEKTRLNYKASASPETLFEVLKNNSSYDLDYKRTLTGPHTEDWQFFLNEQALKAQASQGQKKSFLISLKLAEIAWLQQLGKSPILLMDDIFEKLDHNRIERLFKLLTQFKLPQIFITHTEAEALNKMLSVYSKDFQIINLP